MKRTEKYLIVLFILGLIAGYLLNGKYGVGVALAIEVVGGIMVIPLMLSDPYIE